MITTLRPDLAQPANKKKTKKNKKNIIENKGPKIILCTPIPAIKSTWNFNDSIIQNEIIPIQQEVAKEYNLQVIDLHTLFGTDPKNLLNDGIHPNINGAKKMTQIIADAIKQ